MAFYVVKYGGKKFMNLDLAKNYYNKGNTAFLLALSKGEIDFEILFGTQLIPITDDAHAEVSSYYNKVEYQDIDECMKNFVKPSPSVYVQCEKVHGCVPMFSSSKDKFLKFVDVPFSGKYNKREKIPTIKVCANLFIVVEKVIKGKEKDSILFLIDEE